MINGYIYKMNLGIITTLHEISEVTWLDQGRQELDDEEVVFSEDSIFYSKSMNSLLDIADEVIGECSREVKNYTSIKL